MASRGMPSARGLEWRTDGESRKKYDENFDKINMRGDRLVRAVELPSGVVVLNKKPGRKVYVWNGNKKSDEIRAI